MDEEDLKFLESLKEDFYIETEDMLNKCEEILLQHTPFNQQTRETYQRILHSIKSSASSVELHKCSDIIHIMESHINSSEGENFVTFTLKIIDQLRKYIALMSSREIDEAEKLIVNLLNAIKN